MTHINKVYLVWLMYSLVFNQHYQQSEAAFDMSKEFTYQAVMKFLPALFDYITNFSNLK